MKKHSAWFVSLLSLLAAGSLQAQGIPLVYAQEHTGADCAEPVLPDFDELPTVRPLTDPFEWSDGGGRVSEFDDWRCRRAEIVAELQHYEVGEKPARPEDIRASYADGVLTVEVTENGETLSLSAEISLPEGEGPFPAVIGMGGAYGSLPRDIFTSRGIAGIPFNFGQVMAHTQTRGQEPINALYPDKTYIGAYSAWPWWVSRLIDGLELVADELPIELDRLAVTGCSFAGKMALFTGALDERVALTIAYVADHPHCALPDAQRPEVEAYVDKFLLGDGAAQTAVEIHPFDSVNAERWFDWWGTGEPEFPDVVVDRANVESTFFETECALHGTDWQTVNDRAASGRAYVTIRAGLNSTDAVPDGSESTLTIPFAVGRDAEFYLFGRVNGPSDNDDSIYVKFDDGDYLIANGLGTVGWQWVPVASAELAAGEHTVTITYRQDGLLLDKLNITSFAYGPVELGEAAASNCSP